MASDKQSSAAEPAPAGSSFGATLKRAAMIALVLLGILLGSVAVTALFAGEENELPFDYDGFD